MGDNACKDVGPEVKVGDDSCVGGYSCYGATGSTVIYPSSCRGQNSCHGATGNTVIYPSSCRGTTVCQEVSSVTIGRDSCADGRTKGNSCRKMSDSTVGDRSCRESSSCAYSTRVHIGNQSCDSSSDSCTRMKDTTIGDSSCHSAESCKNSDGVTIGIDSCTNSWSCTSMVDTTVGDHSCGGPPGEVTGYDGAYACQFLKSSSVGNGSCRSYYSCAGEAVYSPATNIKIGHNSCNADASLVMNNYGNTYLLGVCENCADNSVVPDGRCNDPNGIDVLWGTCVYCMVSNIILITHTVELHPITASLSTSHHSFIVFSSCNIQVQDVRTYISAQYVLNNPNRRLDDASSEAEDSLKVDCTLLAANLWSYLEGSIKEYTAFRGLTPENDRLCDGKYKSVHKVQADPFTGQCNIELDRLWLMRPTMSTDQPAAEYIAERVSNYDFSDSGTTRSFDQNYLNVSQEGIDCMGSKSGKSISSKGSKTKEAGSDLD